MHNKLSNLAFLLSSNLKKKRKDKISSNLANLLSLTWEQLLLSVLNKLELFLIFPYHKWALSNQGLVKALNQCGVKLKRKNRVMVVQKRENLFLSGVKALKVKNYRNYFTSWLDKLKMNHVNLTIWKLNRAIQVLPFLKYILITGYKNA